MGKRGTGGRAPGPRVREGQKPGRDLDVRAPTCVPNTTHRLLTHKVLWDARGNSFSGKGGLGPPFYRNRAPGLSEQMLRHTWEQEVEVKA